MKDPTIADEEFAGDSSGPNTGITGKGDSFKWEIAYRELAQSQSWQKQSEKQLREVEGKHSDGSTAPCESTAGPSMNASWQGEGFKSVDRDIAAGRQMEAVPQSAHEGREAYAADRANEWVRVNGELRTEIAERKRTEAALQSAYAELEKGAADRVNELTRVNDELRTEIAERKRTEAMLQSAYAELEKGAVDRANELIRVNDGLRTEIAERKRMEAALQSAYAELEKGAADRANELTRVNDELRTEIAERKRAEAALQSAYEEKEARAAERANELTRVNDGLRTEIAERERAQETLQAAYAKLEARAADRADELMRVNDGLRIEIAERTRTEEALRAAHEELEARAADRANELTRVNDELRTEIAERKKAEEQFQHTLDHFQTIVGTTIQAMGSAVEIKDPFAAGHHVRSAALARNIARLMGLSRDQINAVRMAGSIHDIGKLSIPAEILSKPGKLSEAEFQLVKEHARRGYEILRDVDFPWPLADIIYQHHERMDGSGYPRNMTGGDICIEARIVAVADVVEAMVSPRPYRPVVGIEAALAEIEMNSGILYDSMVVDACLQLFREKGFQFA